MAYPFEQLDPIIPVPDYADDPLIGVGQLGGVPAESMIGPTVLPPDFLNEPNMDMRGTLVPPSPIPSLELPPTGPSLEPEIDPGLQAQMQAQLTPPEPDTAMTDEDIEAQLQAEMAKPHRPETPLERAGRQAQSQADIQSENARKEAELMVGFAERSEEIAQRTEMARKRTLEQIETIDAEIDSDRQELRSASRAREKGPSGASILVGGALETFVTLLTGERPDMQLLDQVVAKDASRKAGAVTEAKRRLGISQAERGDLLGNERERTYWANLETSETWTNIGNRLMSDAAKEKDLGLRQVKENAADVAMQRAQQAAVQAQQGAVDRKVKEQMSLAKLETERLKGRKMGAEVAKLERRGRGGTGTGFDAVTEKQLRGLKPKVQKHVKNMGVRDIRGNFLVNPDGTFVTANTAKEAQDIRSGMGSVQTVNDQLNKLLALREKHGMEWGMLNSAARQEMEGAAAQLEATMNKALKLGALDAGSLEVIQRMTGSANPAGWYDKSATWSALQKDVEGGVNRQLRAHSSFKGQFTLPKRKTMDRTLKQIETTIDKPVDPVSGKIIPSETRMEALKESRQKLSGKETGRGKVGLRLATELSAEKTESRVNRDHVKIMKQLEAMKRKARKAGDKAMVRQIDDSMVEQMKFARDAGEWAYEQDEKIKEGEIASEKERSQRAAQKERAEREAFSPRAAPGKI